MEKLDRGVIAVRSGNSNYIGWRLFGTDPADIGFNVYRDSVKLNSTPITNSTNYLDTGGTLSSTYRIVPVINGIERKATEPVSVWSTPYLTIPLQVPSGVTTPDGYTCTYSPNDCSVGDLDGDGQYEIIVKWDPDNSKDNSVSGYTGNVYLDAYKLNGTFLWRIDLGINIRAGAHYTQFMVYDLDSDGRAEVACKTAPYTVDGQGNYVLMPGDVLADYRNSSGYILSGPEYLTIFDGLTGAELATTYYVPPRGNVSSWGDSYGNRVDRFLACVAYLDGQRPSLVMCRGYYTRAVLAAWDWRDGQLTQRWVFDTNNGYSSYMGQGNHNLSVADVDGDGFDEIVYGSCTIDHNGKGLYSTGLGHGDALHVSDMDPDRPGLEVWQCHESSPYGASFRDAATGQVIFRYTASGDTGRACAGDIRADYRGYEVWASTGVPLSTCTGVNLGSHSNPINFMVWWDGDLLREFLDSNVISKYGVGTLLTATGCSANNGSKSTPCLSADIFGDWREEVIWRTNDNAALRIYTTTAVAGYRFYTLMHDPQYRLAIAWQNVAYNQPPHPGFYLGDGMASPPVPDIILAGDIWVYGDFTNDDVVNLDDLPSFADIWLLNDCGLTPGLDLNEDCRINYYEFAVFAENWEGPERIPPAVPTGLLAWAGDGMVTLDWADNTESDLLGYNVYRSETSGSGYILLNPEPLTASAYVDTSVQNGLTYYYVVTAVDNLLNESAYSSEVIAAPDSITTIVIQENEPGFIGVFTGTIDSNNAGFTGTGFANTANAVGMYIEWSVYAASAGTYELQWRYANGSTSNRTGAVSVSGVTRATNVSFPSTGGWTTWTTTAAVPVPLSAGSNRIRLIAEKSEGLANIDWMSVTGVSPLPGS
ncbi:MAG TPA: DUF5010 C-terminal domain-containing protein [Anaerohalosphaeraceae bacterium]|nr:DUF5010 C-terminal domain-containing protein [Anaerohalosphaeraceae bacterium]